MAEEEWKVQIIDAPGRVTLHLEGRLLTTVSRENLTEAIVGLVDRAFQVGQAMAAVTAEGSEPLAPTTIRDPAETSVGKEAEDLRAGIAGLIETSSNLDEMTLGELAGMRAVDVDDLEELLENIDAGESLAWKERQR